MTVKRKPGRPVKDAYQKEIDRLEIDRLKNLIARQDDAVEQARDQIAELISNVEFYRKQVNHFLALVNILAKGS
jgi:hypothetical protein